MAHTIDRFKSYDSFLAFLSKHFENDEAESIASHEKSHYDEAVKLGYAPVYAAQVICESGLGVIPLGVFAIDFPDGHEPTYSDLIGICLAPENPSERDLELVEEARRNLSTKSTKPL